MCKLIYTITDLHCPVLTTSPVFPARALASRGIFLVIQPMRIRPVQGPLCQSMSNQVLSNAGESLMTKLPSFEELVPSAPKGRFDGIKRSYTVADVLRLRGSF